MQVPEPAPQIRVWKIIWAERLKNVIYNGLLDSLNILAFLIFSMGDFNVYIKSDEK